MTPTWTNLQDLDLGETITSATWNNIMGPSGNMAYLKSISDNFSNTIFQKYTALGITGSFGYTVNCGWPQGLSAQQGQTGTMVTPTWALNGLPINNYLTINGPAKYIAVLQIQAKSYQITNSEYSIFRVLIQDTSGNINLNIPIFNFSNGSTETSFNFQIPFVINAEYNIELLIGFIAQQDFQNSNSASLNGKVTFEVLPTISFQKLPSLINTTNIVSSFVFGTSNLTGEYFL